MITIEYIYNLFTKSSGVYTDSRKPLIDGIFVALKGPLFNGNHYALNAVDQGALFAIVDDYKLSQKSEKLIHVEDTYSTLKNIANYHRKKLNCPVLAITGSNGKTTTKEIIKAVIGKKHETHGTIGNLNNHIGVPLTILNTPLSSEFLIIEMGANHINEIAELCLIAEPTHGFITNFGKAHIEGFGSEKGVIEGKSELYNYLSNTNGTIFVNIENKKQIKKLDGIPYISFGDSKKSNYKISYLSRNNKLELSFNGITINSSLHGEYNLKNIAAAIIIGYFFKIPTNKIKMAIESYKSDNNRSQLIKLKKYNIILDAYNANPSSMEVALKSFQKRYPTNSLIIIGDMLELGNLSTISHKKIIQLVESLSFSKVISIGENFIDTKVNSFDILQFKTTKELIGYLKENSINEKNIFIKGSRSLGLEKILSFF